MKKLFFAFLFTILAGCSGDSVHRAAEKLDDQPLNKIMFLNAVESLFGCENTQDVVELVQFFRTQKAVYECQGEFNTFVSTYEVVDKTDHTMHYILGVCVFGFVLAAIVFIIKNRSTGTKILTLNTAGEFLGFVIHTAMRAKLRFIFALFCIVGWMLSTGFLKEADDAKLFQEKAVEMPHLSVKNRFAKDIYNYLLCVKSNTFDSKENPSINILKTNNGYKLEAQYQYCQLNGGFVIDKEGVEIAKANSFFDYEKMQEEQIVKHLNTLISKIDLVAKRTAIAQKTQHQVTIPKLLTCENTPVSYTGLTKEDRYNVIWKDLECAGRSFVLSMNKTKDMTEDRLESLVLISGSRKIHMCDGAFTTQAFTDRKGMQEKYKSCITENCSGSASLYACSVALGKYNKVATKRYMDFLITSTFSIFEDEPDTRSAKMFLGTLNAKTQFDENFTPFTIDRKPMALLPVSLESSSQMSFQDVANFLQFIDLLDLEKAAIEFSPLDFLNRQIDPGNGGIYGTDRYKKCFSNPYGIFDKSYDCGGFTYESKLLGDKFYAGWMQLVLMNKLMTAKEGREKLAKTDPAYTAAKEGMKMAGIKKTALAAILPFMFDDLGGLIFEDVYQENYHEVMGQKGEYYAAMTCVMISKPCADVIDKATDALFIGYVIFSWVIPLTPLFVMTGLIAAYFTPVFFRPMTMVLRFIIQFGKEQNDKSIDKHDVVLESENLILKPMSIAVGFILSQIFFLILAVFFIQDITEFTSSIVEITATEAGPLGEIIITLYSLFFIYLFYMVSMFLWVAYIASVERRDGVVTTADGKIQNAAEMKRYGKALKGKGLD